MIPIENTFIEKFLKQESAGGILLVLAAMLAIVWANSPFDYLYRLLLDTPVVIKFGALEINKPLLLWVNDGLMAVFFFMVGLELKREFLEGELSDKKNIILPGLGALGGMVVPSAIYIYLNYDDPVGKNGWAIPAATDIAFALGVLSLLGSRVPTSLKIFLTSLAIFDDVGAILIIALFYTSKITITALVVAAVCICLLFILNRRNVLNESAYIVLGVVMWIALLKSGIHATLAGIVLAMFIPLYSRKDRSISPLKVLESDLHFTVAFIILPVFAFFNAGISFAGLGVEQLVHNVPLGIALGLFIGKPLGVFVFCWLGIKLRLTELPKDSRWGSLFGIAVLCGIGFTMSLFIGSLAFEESGMNNMFDERLGILLGSLAAGIFGYVILKSSLRNKT